MPREEVVVRVPVRIDFAGGWTDVHYFSSAEGGAVLNAAINHLVEGRASWSEGRLHVEYGLELPSGSGLGTSGALDVAWLALTNQIIGRAQSQVDLAEGAYKLEKLLGVEGGKQDQYAAALGGFNLLRFGAEADAAEVEPLHVRPVVVCALEESSVLCYSGSSHDSSSVHRLVWERYQEGDQRTIQALRSIRDSVQSGRDALLKGDLPALAEVLSHNREMARALHPALVTKRMDELFATGKGAGAMGAKACGAGSGGCLYFLCQPDRRAEVETALQERGAQILPFRFHAEGTAVQSQAV